MNNKGEITFMECVVITVIVMLVIAILWPLCARPFFTCEIDAKLYNAKFKTHYTAHDFFWDGDTIKSMLQGGQQDTHNYNISGAIPVKIQN